MPRSIKTAVPNREGKEEAVSPQKKGSQPRLAAWTLPPSYGRRCPEGAEVGWGKRDEKERGRSSQAGNLRKHPSAAARSPFPNRKGK